MRKYIPKRPYKIILQDTRFDGLVECKRIGFYPYETKGGETRFKPLGFKLLQIIVSNGSDTMKLKKSKDSWLIEHESTWLRPKVKMGKGKRAEMVRDYLNPELIEKKNIDRFPLERLFVAYCERVFGVELTKRIIELFELFEQN